jgi:hypothetical protein
MEERKEVMYYTYVRDGVEYCTSCESIASMRSDDGQYNIVYGYVQDARKK